MTGVEKRVSVSISLTDAEKEELATAAKNYGLSLSAFLRLAAKEDVTNHAVKEIDEDKCEWVKK